MMDNDFIEDELVLNWINYGWYSFYFEIIIVTLSFILFIIKLILFVKKKIK